MNKNKKFENFLESLKGNGQDTLIENVKKGFQACYENSLESGFPIDSIVKGYIDAMLWTEEEEIGKDKSVSDLPPETMNSITTDVKKFYQTSEQLLENIPDDYTDRYGYEQVGHDFWLTRNGHGAGFWDRGLGELGDKLTEISKQFGESNLYIGDDGELYVM